jgi:hypothetical protein
MLLYNNIILNRNIFIEVNYIYKPIEEYNIEKKDIYDFIDECIEILVKKQKCK